MGTSHIIFGKTFLISTQTYPEIRSVRYPKPGTNNPTVTLTVADIADPKHIRTRHLTPPKVIIEEG